MIDRAEPGTATLRTTAVANGLARPMLRRRLRRVHRTAADVHVQLAIALAVPTLLAAVVEDSPNLGLVVAGGVLAAAAQIAIALRGRELVRAPLVRLAIALVSVTVAIWLVGGNQPLTALYIPVVALGAAIGKREGLVLAAVTGALYVAPLLVDAVPGTFQAQRGLAHATVVVLLALGTRRTVVALERAILRARLAGRAEHHRAAQAAGVEDVGRELARDGLTPESMSAVTDLLAARFGYPFVSIYLRHGEEMRLGAQRGYAAPIEVIPAGRGIIGRVLRTAEPILVTDTGADSRYVSANPAVTSEVCVPMVVGGELLGILNVESGPQRPLDATDLRSMQLVAERLASALALSRERGRLAERAEAFRRVTEFALGIARPSPLAELVELVATRIRDVVACDIVGLVLALERPDDFRIAAVAGPDAGLVGRPVRPGEGMTGLAIATGRYQSATALGRADYPAAVQAADMPDRMSTAAVPIVVDGTVIGALSLHRLDLEQPFGDLDREVLELAASQVGLAIANARLQQELHDASIPDALTGLHNRRHLDASLERLMAVRARIEPAERRPVAAILFDLDHFGRLNKAFGHPAGDEVLRIFAATLAGRFRAGDLVARYGGEEFLVVLDGSTRDGATAKAEGVVAAVRALAIEVATAAEPVRLTVSAGVAELPAGSTSAAALVEACDRGLRLAKAAGRDRVRIA